MTCTAVIKSYFESENGFISGEVVIFFYFAHSLVGTLNTGRLWLCKSLREMCKSLLQLHTEGQLLHKVGTTVSLSFFFLERFKNYQMHQSRGILTLHSPPSVKAKWNDFCFL